MQNYKPLDIINDILLGGMKTVGDLFGAGKMQLPFVLQSAETMKAAVRYLEPHMERVEGQEKGTVVLATVRGDVHDIGKNLVDIILTNNGYRVVNLGIKQPISSILEAAVTHKADAVGMSGLLVKSTVVMRENLEEMSRQGLSVPVMLGGAALTRRYVEEDCVKCYEAGRVAYARDAFDGLDLMDKIVTGRFDTHLAEVRRKNEGRPVNQSRKLGRAADPRPMRPVDAEEIRLRRAELTRNVPIPEPPFWGPRTIARVPAKAVVPYLNERMLYQFQWGYRKDGRSLAEYREWAKDELRPVLRRILDIAIREDILVPQAAYGYWPCAAEGNDVILFDMDGERELTRFSFPRQNKQGGLCIADFFRDVAEQRARRDRSAGRDDGQARIGGGARVVRRQPLPGLPLFARPLGRDGRGAWPNTSTSASAANWVLPPRKPATPTRCSPKATAAAAIPSATPPAPTSPTSSNYWRYCAPRKSASPSAKKTSSTPSNPPPPSSSTTPRPNTSRCKAAVFPAARENAGKNPHSAPKPPGKFAAKPFLDNGLACRGRPNPQRPAGKISSLPSRWQGNGRERQTWRNFRLAPITTRTGNFNLTNREIIPRNLEICRYISKPRHGPAMARHQKTMNKKNISNPTKHKSNRRN